ncbi:MAG TPA: hypothetical protein VFQ35_01170 [Polyangiaceae bacterium]|nr:hypothetical protein [Polyangiaceae bacterium]
MSRTLSLLNAGLFTLALALPAAAAPRDLGSNAPSCGGTDGTKKDEKKNPSVADAQCDGPKTDGKGDKKNPSVADAQCDGPKTDGKGDKKNPSLG